MLTRNVMAMTVNLICGSNAMQYLYAVFILFLFLFYFILRLVVEHLTAINTKQCGQNRDGRARIHTRTQSYIRSKWMEAKKKRSKDWIGHLPAAHMYKVNRDGFAIAFAKIFSPVLFILFFHFFIVCLYNCVQTHSLSRRVFFFSFFFL